MRRFLTILVSSITMMCMAMGSTAHAVQFNLCADAVVGASQDHARDQDSEKPGKPIEHQHIGCHGHCLVAVPAENVAMEVQVDLDAPVALRVPALLARASHPGLRPPQA